MENVSARYCSDSGSEDNLSSTRLLLPAGPRFRIEKEVKNVITSIAKTCHYWDDHMLISQQSAIRELFERMNAEHPYVQPPLFRGSGDASTEIGTEMSAAIHAATGLRAASQQYFGWLGLECSTVATAVWMMRALVTFNVASRREETTLFVAVDPGGTVATIQAVPSVHRLTPVRATTLN